MLNSCKKRGRRTFAFAMAVIVIVAIAAFAKQEENRASASPTSAGEGGSRYHVLLMGQDEAAGLTDVMMLVSVDTESGRVCLAQIPRDTYFRYTKKDYKKINGAMGALGGAEQVCRALEKAFSVEIDAYVLLDLDFVRSAVDMMGGVEIDVPCDMHYEDPAQGLSIHIKKGRQVLRGAEAVEFVRFRSGYIRGDLGRMDAQKLFLSAFFEAAGNTLGDDVPRLAMLAMRSVKTDMRVDRVISLLRAARTISPESITLLTLPGEEVQSPYSGAWYYVLSRAGTAAVLEEHFGVVGASACIDPAHLFSNAARKDLESVYRREILPIYYTVSELRKNGLTVPSY